MSEITPIVPHKNYFIKREDLAADKGPEFASGAKVRQYLAMCDKHPDKPLVVGCAAHSCQQVYIADASRRTGRRAVVFTAGRAEVTAATQYCIDHGCEMHYVKPGHLSVIRSRAKEFYEKIGGCVPWSSTIATDDARKQASAYERPDSRIVVPVGSGAMLVGILAGLCDRFGDDVPLVLGVRVSQMADPNDIQAAVAKLINKPCPPFELKDHPNHYNDGLFGRFLGGILLDPWYAAKCKEFMQPGDCLWNTGRRPHQIMKQ